MKIFIPMVLYFLLQGEIPFKNSDEFQVKLDLKFKQRPPSHDPNTYSSEGDRLDQQKSDLAAFLVVEVSQLKILDDESKILVVNSKGKILVRKKSKPLPALRFEMGFVEDLKKGEIANEVIVYLLSSEKKELRKIVCSVQPDGTFQVNGKWHGKF